jgi:dihydrofolate reductase
LWYGVAMSIHEVYKGPAILAAQNKGPEVIAIAAIGKSRVLGEGNELVWHIPDDLKRFKAETLGHPMILGRKTFESILGYLGKPLPGRTNIVVTRDTAWKYEGVVTAHSIEEAVSLAKALDQEKVFIGGGAQIYAAALPYTDVLMLTLIDDDKPGDAFFPPYELEFTRERFREDREHNGLKYTWIDLAR